LVGEVSPGEAYRLKAAACARLDKAVVNELRQMARLEACRADADYEASRIACAILRRAANAVRKAWRV